MDSIEDHIREVKWEEKQGRLSKEFMVLHGNDKYRRMKYIYTNNELYEVSVYSLENDLKSGKVDDFLSSFKFTPSPKTIFADKGKKLLEDLMLEDSALFQDAKQALGIVKFFKKDIPLLEMALLKNYENDNGFYHRKVKDMLLQAMHRSFPKDYPTLIKEMYLDNKNHPDLQCAILKSLADLAEDSLYFYTYLSLLKDELPSELSLNYYDISVAAKSKYSHELVDVYSSLLDGSISRVLFIQALGSIASDSLGKVEKKIEMNFSEIEFCLSEYVLPAIQRDDVLEVYYSEQILNLVDLFPKDKREKWYNLFLKDKHKYIQYDVVVRLLKNDSKVDQKYIRTFFADIQYRYNLYSELKKLDKLSLLTEKEMTERNIAEGYFVNYIEYDDEYVAKCYIVEEKQIQFKGKKTTIYLIKFKIGSDKIYFAGICIPEAINQKVDDNNMSYAYSDYKYFNVLLPEKHMDEMIKNLEEMKRD